MIVGWRCAANMRTEMVLDALEMARRSRDTVLPGVLLRFGRCRDRLAASRGAGAQRSRSPAGRCADGLVQLSVTLEPRIAT
jgi:transposase InsO family protein